MRFNLSTPFAEKDQAKALGARWDPESKVWYVLDVEDLTPFKRWKPIPMRALAGTKKISKNDTVSHLADDQATQSYTPLTSGVGDEEFLKIMDAYENPKWTPKAGYQYAASTDDGLFFVIPDIKNPNSFHITRLLFEGEIPSEAEEDEGGDGGKTNFTRWPEHAKHVEFRLRQFGMQEEPGSVDWHFSKEVGASEPFCAPPNHGKIRVTRKDGSVMWLPDAC